MRVQFFSNQSPPAITKYKAAITVANTTKDKPSVSTDRLTPAFPRSVGLGPIFSPRRCRGHRPVHPQPVPITALQFITSFDADLPAFQEHAGGDPLPKAIIRRGCGAPVCRVQRRPPTTGTEHKRWRRRSGDRTRGDDRRQTDGCSRGPAGAAPARPTGRPRCERRSWSCGLVCARALGCWFSTQYHQYTGFSDRLLVQHIAHNLFEPVEGKGLGQVIIDALLTGALLQFGGGICRNEHNARVGRCFFDRSG